MARACVRGQKGPDPPWGAPVCQLGTTRVSGKEARPKTAPVLGDVGEGKLGKSFVSCYFRPAILERRQLG